MAEIIQIRRDTSTNWTSENPTPHHGEVCWEIDTNKLKLGDGTTAWNSLPYYYPGTTFSGSGTSGLVPNPGSELGYFLKDDGTWGTPDSATPTAHATSHENGGSDEINVAGLSGKLADAQTPTSHASTHTNGTDDITTFSGSGTKGLVPDPGSEEGNCLKDDGTWGTARLPAGVIGMKASNNLPAYTLWCDGSAVSRTEYAALFADIGTTWGVGDGSTTFNLPNLNDANRFPRGNSTAGGTGGSATHTHSVDPPNTTSTSAGGHNHGGATGGPSATTGMQLGILGTVPTTNHTHSISSVSAHTHDTNIAAFDSASGSSLPPYVNVKYFIWY